MNINPELVRQNMQNLIQIAKILEDSQLPPEKKTMSQLDQKSLKLIREAKQDAIDDAHTLFTIDAFFAKYGHASTIRMSAVITLLRTLGLLPKAE